jgi:cytochrome P450
MHLLSETVVQGGPKGPVHPKRYDQTCAVDLSDPESFREGPPIAALAALREAAPVSWQEEKAADEPGFWAVTGYEAVMRVNGDPETFSSQRGGILLASGPPEMRHPLLFRASMDTMINMDAPWHMQLRREHMPFFTPRYLADLKLKVAAETTRLLDAMAPLGECDLVETLSSRLPLFTLCEILGVPPADRERFLGWMHYLEMAQNLANDRQALANGVTEELLTFVQTFNDNINEMFDYGRHMLHKRREDPRPDLMTAIARAQVDGTLLRDEYLDGSWLLIVFAGNDTTRNTISGSVKLLTEFPDQKDRLMADPGLIPNAVNEFIRMVSPVMYMRRTAAKDVVVEDQLIAEGEKVVMYYGAANRDPAVFADPDVLDVGRANADKHIAFGYGPHVCLGKRVAQLQLETVHEQLLNRFPDLAYTGGIDVAPNNFVYAIRKLPVAFTPKLAA